MGLISEDEWQDLLSKQKEKHLVNLKGGQERLERDKRISELKRIFG
jgi:hypothetical protein